MTVTDGQAKQVLLTEEFKRKMPHLYGVQGKLYVRLTAGSGDYSRNYKISGYKENSTTRSMVYKGHLYKRHGWILQAI